MNATIAKYPMLFQFPENNAPGSLLGSNKPAPTKPTNYMDAAAMFQTPQKDVGAELKSMGILDRAAVDERYYTGVTDRDEQRKRFALGQMLGALGGTLAGRFIGGNDAQQNVQNLLPAVQGTQSMLQHVAGQDQKADAEHNAALKQFYDATFDLRKQNDQIAQHNQETSLGLYKADMARKERPSMMGTHTVAKNGRTYEVTDYGDPNTGQVFTQQHLDLTPHVGGSGSTNEIRENTAFVAIRDLMKEKEKEEAELVSKKNELLGRIRDASDPSKNADEAKYNYNAQNIARDKQTYAALDEQHKQLVNRYNGRLAEIQKAVGWNHTAEAPAKINVKGGGAALAAGSWMKNKQPIKKSN